MPCVDLGYDVFTNGITLIIRDDGSCFIEVLWYGENWSYNIEIPNDLEKAKKFWLDFNYSRCNKNCCCTINPCSHSPPPYSK